MSRGQPKSAPAPAWLFWLVFVASFAALSVGVAPSATFHDSNEFAMAAGTWGVPHPPGAPLYVLLAGAFVHLFPFRDPAFGTNLFSALCAAATLGLTSALAWHLSPPEWARGRWLAAIAAPLVLLGSPAFLEQAFTTEQYTLLTAVMAGFLLVLWRYLQTHDARHAVGAAALAGLAICNHPSQVVLALPLAVGLYLARAPLRIVGLAALGFVLPLVTYLWVPYSSSRQPLINWGHVQTWDRLWWAITRQQWPSGPLGEAPAGFAAEWMRSYDLLGQLGVLGLLLAAGGLVIALRGRCWRLLLPWVAIVPYAAVLLLGHMRQQGIDTVYIQAYGVIDWHLPVYLGAALLAGAFLGWVASLRAAIWYASAAAILPLAAFTATSIFTNSLRGCRAAAAYTSELLRGVPAGSAVVLGADDTAGPALYRRWMLGEYTPYWISYGGVQRYMLPASGGGVTWDRNYKTAYLTERVADPDINPFRLPRLTTVLAASRPLYIDFDPGYPLAAERLEPAGLLFKVKDSPLSQDDARLAEAVSRASFPDLYRRPVGPQHRLERLAYSQLHQRRGLYFQAMGLWREAEACFALSLAWNPRNGEVMFGRGYALQQQGRLSEAEGFYRGAIELLPSLPGPRRNLAILSAQRGDFEGARRLAEEELGLSPKDQATQTLLRLLRERAGPVR